MAISPLTMTPDQIRDSFLSVIKNGLFDLGIEDANVSQGSDYWVMAEALGAQMSQLFNYALVVRDAAMPDSATGADLDRQLATFGLTRRVAGGSAGSIKFSTDFTTFVPTGAELTSNSGQRYEVTLGGSYSDGGIIPIAALDVGTATNLEVTEVLTWASAPFGSGPTANLNTALVNGVDAETDEVARARLLELLSNPPAAGNWSWIVRYCEALDPAIMKSFVYPANNGPSTVHVALMAEPAESSKSREIDSIKMSQTLIPNIVGSMPEYVETVVTTVNDVPADVSFEITLPLATPTSSPITGPGNGTGWIDAAPWPQVNGTTHFFCPVTAVFSNQQFTISSPSGIAPSAGVTRISWIDRSTWTVKTARVQSYIGSVQFTLTTDLPFVGISVGDWIFPAAVQMQNYVDAALEAFRQMGPGQKLDIGAFPIGARKPLQQDSFPSTIAGPMLKYINESGEEVQTTEFYYRSTQTPAVESDSTANIILVPQVTSSPGDPPNIFIPRQLGFYQSTNGS